MKQARDGGTGDQSVHVSPEEDRRLAAVRRYEILGTPPDRAFDRVAALAARLLGMPAASVTIVGEDRIWFKAAYGLDGVREIGRDRGLCASAVCSDNTLVIPDILRDPVAAAHPLAAGPFGMRFYAAAPIITSDGYRLGTVNVLDIRPRTITDADATTLAELAAVVMDELEMRLAALRAVRAERQRRQIEHRRAQAEHWPTLRWTAGSARRYMASWNQHRTARSRSPWPAAAIPRPGISRPDRAAGGFSRSIFPAERSSVSLPSPGSSPRW